MIPESTGEMNQDDTIPNKFSQLMPLNPVHHATKICYLYH